MTSLDEQLALFEREMLSTVAAETKREVKTEERPIQAHEIGGSSSASAPTTTKFVPHQLQQRPPSLPTMPNHPPFRFANPPMPAPDSVFESGPTLYAPPPNAAGTSKSSGKEKGDSAPTGSFNSMMQQQQFKTQALPSDVELLMAKKQASKAHENSYLGAVLRGEKKMKKFVRSCGGQNWEDASMAEWDPNDFRIFCGDLGNEVSDELLAKAFRKFPSFQKAKVVRDSRTNKSKGFGFVSFRNQEDFIRAMKEMDGKYVGNRPIKLRKSNWKDRNADVVKKKNKEKKKLGLV